MGCCAYNHNGLYPACLLLPQQFTEGQKCCVLCMHSCEKEGNKPSWCYFSSKNITSGESKSPFTPMPQFKPNL